MMRSGVDKHSSHNSYQPQVMDQSVNCSLIGIDKLYHITAKNGELILGNDMKFIPFTSQVYPDMVYSSNSYLDVLSLTAHLMYKCEIVNHHDIF